MFNWLVFKCLCAKCKPIKSGIARHSLNSVPNLYRHITCAYFWDVSKISRFLKYRINIVYSMWKDERKIQNIFTPVSGCTSIIYVSILYENVITKWRKENRKGKGKRKSNVKHPYKTSSVLLED